MQDVYGEFFNGVMLYSNVCTNSPLTINKDIIDCYSVNSKQQH